MDPRLLEHYRNELLHLREMGAEFAAQFPKIASRLRMDSTEVADPYVERLLEGFAFLAARIQLKLDAEFPRFTQQLLDVLLPQQLAPTPSMLVAELSPQSGDAALASGAVVPRGSMLRSRARAGETPCRFTTAHDVLLWPLELTAALYFSHATGLPPAVAGTTRKFGGGLRFTLRATGGMALTQVPEGALRLHLAGLDEVAWRLHELVCGSTVEVLVRCGSRHERLPSEAVQPVGFEEEHALLRRTLRGFEGHRLLQEYVAFPQRFLFFDVEGLGAALRRLGGPEAEVVLLFSRGDASLQQAVDAGSLRLHCTPAINQFEHRCDRIHLGVDAHEHHVVPDRTRPLDYEVIEVLEVTGHGSGLEAERRFTPLYAAFHPERHPLDAYFTVRREPRVLSQAQRRDGPRSSYVGSEMFLAVVDLEEAPYSADLQQLGVRALCSNRDLPLLLATGGDDLALEQTAAVSQVRIVRGPSRPLPARLEGNLAWRFIGQLTLNHLSLSNVDEDQGAAALRQQLMLHVPAGDSALARQFEGIRRARTRPVVRRLPLPGPIAFGRGVEIEVEVDDLAFQGASTYLLGCVLERWFARHVSLNGFTQTRLRSPDRGDILVGRPRVGARPIM